MTAILYRANETDFSHLGLGLLNDAISILVTEERNGIFELEMQYPVSGDLFAELKNDRLIKADAGHNLKDQRFKIIRITKPLNGIVTLYAEHVSYLTQDLALRPQVNFRGNAHQALQTWKDSLVDDNPFIVSSDITTTGNGSWSVTEVENARRALGGVSGSILDVYGGEYRFDNYQIRLMRQRGVNSAALIAYGRNLVDLTQEEEIANTYTSIYPYSVYTDDDGNQQLVTLPEYFIDSKYVGNYARRKILTVDFSQEEVETVSALRNATNRYITANNVGIPKVNLKIKYIDLARTLDYKNQAVLEEVNLCDNVPVYFEKFDINTTAKVIKTVWDDLLEQYDSVEIGEVRSSLSDSINATVDGKVERVEKKISNIQLQADGMKLIYRQTEEPPPGSHVGDLWYQPNGIYEIMYQWDGSMWKEVLNTQDLDNVKRDVDQAMDYANESRNRANEAVGKADLASDNASEALLEAQESFDKAQESLKTAQGLTSRMGSAEESLSTLQQTSSSFATRIENAEGDINTLTSTAQGLQNRISDAEGNITSVTSTASALQTKMSNVEGSINTLTETATSMRRTITSVREDLEGLEIGGTNLQRHTEFSGELSSRSPDGWTFSNQSTSPDIAEVIPSPWGTEGVQAYHIKVTNARAYLLSSTSSMIPVREGEFVTISVKADSDDLEIWREFEDENGNRIGLNANQSFTKSNRHFITIKVPERAVYFRVVRIGIGTSTAYSGRTREVRFEGLKIEKGNKATDWTPAPEDTQSQITQLSDNINLRVMKDDVINQINISTEEVLISGNKLILDGDTTVTGTFRVANANITNVSADKMTTGTLDAGQVNVINMNASNITTGTLDAINITGGKITQRSSGGRIEMFDGNLEVYNGNNKAIQLSDYRMRFYNSDGTEIGRIYPITSLVSGQRGIGIRVDKSSHLGIGVQLSGTLYPSLMIDPNSNRAYLAGPYSGLIPGSRLGLYANRRPLSYENDFGSTDQPAIIMDQSDDTNNVHQYFGGVNRRSGAIWEVRHNNTADGWRSILLAENNGVTARDKLAIRTDGALSGGLHIGTGIYRHIITRHSENGNMIIYPQRQTGEDILRVRSHHELGNFRNDLRIRYNGDVTSKQFINNSLAETKDNIKKWNCDALEIINRSCLYKWNRDGGKMQYGFVIGEGYSTPDELISEYGDGISNYSHSSLNTKAIQELDHKVDLTREELVLKVAQLESRLNQLEVA